MFAQAVRETSQAHAEARWILPLDSFFEKSGTYTNTFGVVQRLRRATRVIEKDFEPLSVLSRLAVVLGREANCDVPGLYAEIAKGLPKYPRAIAEIPESKMTYSFYERALWR